MTVRGRTRLARSTSSIRASPSTRRHGAEGSLESEAQRFSSSGYPESSPPAGAGAHGGNQFQGSLQHHLGRAVLLDAVERDGFDSGGSPGQLIGVGAVRLRPSSARAASMRDRVCRLEVFGMRSRASIAPLRSPPRQGIAPDQSRPMHSRIGTRYQIVHMASDFEIARLFGAIANASFGASSPGRSK